MNLIGDDHRVLRSLVHDRQIVARRLEEESAPSPVAGVWRDDSIQLPKSTQNAVALDRNFTNQARKPSPRIRIMTAMTFCHVFYVQFLLYLTNRENSTPFFWRKKTLKKTQSDANADGKTRVRVLRLPEFQIENPTDLWHSSGTKSKSSSLFNSNTDSACACAKPSRAKS